jgi:hypothetical protein
LQGSARPAVREPLNLADYYEFEGTLVPPAGWNFPIGQATNPLSTGDSRPGGMINAV